MWYGFNIRRMWMEKIFLMLTCCFFINSFACIGAVETDSKPYTKPVSTLETKINSDIEDEMNNKRLELAKQEKVEMGLKPISIESPSSLLHVLLMYLPNRIIDLTDIVSIGFGFGPEASCEIILTEYCQFSAAYGDRYFIEKGYNRQYGGGYSSGYNTSYLCWRKKMTFTDFTFGTVEPYVVMDKDSAIPCPCKKPYSNGILDFWKIGIHAGWIVDITAGIHPVAIANFFTGFFFIRLTDTEEI